MKGRSMKKRRNVLPGRLVTLALALLLPLASLTGCARTSPAQTTPEKGVYQTITPEDYMKMLDDGEAHVLVDVRTAAEFDAEHLEGAVNIPVETLTGEKPASLPDTDAVVVLYCRSGNRSETAANQLLALGYQKVYDLGGIIDWPYETVRADGLDTPESTPAGSSGNENAESETGILGTFEAGDIDGNAVNESLFTGYKLTLVNVWATFCGPCIDEMPGLGELHRAYADKGVQVVGIVIDVTDSKGNVQPELLDTARDIIELTAADYRHLLPSADLNDALLNEVTAVPTTIFVDEKGNQVGETYVGSMDSTEWSAVIDGLLNEIN
jgi:rhodanese-related sulfurtransferase/thiol-disulfide isomerase/thioredoxin